MHSGIRTRNRQHAYILDQNRNKRIEKKWKSSDPRQTPKFATAASAATYSSLFCARCDLPPKHQKPTTKMQLHSGVRTRNRHQAQFRPKPQHTQRKKNGLGGGATHGKPPNSQPPPVRSHTTRPFARAVTCSPKHQKPRKIITARAQRI